VSDTRDVSPVVTIMICYVAAHARQAWKASATDMTMILQDPPCESQASISAFGQHVAHHQSLLAPLFS
jgi:hypothetical protein